MRSLPDTVAKQTVEYNTAASGGDSNISLAANSEQYNVIDWVAWSYNGAPTSGSLEIKNNTANTTLLKVDITAGGPGELVFGDRGLVGAKGAELLITLADGTQTSMLTVQSR